jgi:hypothetical protein
MTHRDDGHDTHDATELEFAVEGLPPAKSEAKSMLGIGHPHESRVRRLLEEALAASNEREFPGFSDRLVALEVVLRCPGDPPSDATNYLGGITDVLEAKTHRGTLDHLGDLAGVALYDNDRQVRELAFRHEDARPARYTVRLRHLDAAT